MRKTNGIDELLCCFDVKVLVCKAKNNVKYLMAEKKLAWTGLDKVKKVSDVATSSVTRRALGVGRYALGVTRWA